MLTSACKTHCPEICYKADLKSTLPPASIAALVWTIACQLYHGMLPQLLGPTLLLPEKEPHVPTSLGHSLLIPGPRRVFLSLGHEPLPELQERRGGSCFPRLCLPRGRRVHTARNHEKPLLSTVCMLGSCWLYILSLPESYSLYLVILLTLLCIFLIFFTSLLCLKAPPRFIYTTVCVRVCARL